MAYLKITSPNGKSRLEGVRPGVANDYHDILEVLEILDSERNNLLKLSVKAEAPLRQQPQPHRNGIPNTRRAVIRIITKTGLVDYPVLIVP